LHLSISFLPTPFVLCFLGTVDPFSFCRPSAVGRLFPKNVDRSASEPGGCRKGLPFFSPRKSALAPRSFHRLFFQGASPEFFPASPSQSFFRFFSSYRFSLGGGQRRVREPVPYQAPPECLVHLVAGNRLSSLISPQKSPNTEPTPGTTVFQEFPVRLIQMCRLRFLLNS